MLPEELLLVRERDGRVHPAFLDEGDHPWLRELVAELGRFVGRPRRMLDARLREPLPFASPPSKRALAIHAWSGLARNFTVAAVPPRAARSTLFVGASRTPGKREDVLGRAAAALGVTATAVEESLFADLPDERRVGEPPEDLTPGRLALLANLSLARGLVSRSSRVDLRVRGHVRPVIRHAKLKGLLCTVVGSDSSACRLEVSGPLALFRHTHVYGHALAGLLPLLAWCSDFRLAATCQLRGRELRFELASGDPFLPAGEPRAFDSKLEARFEREFARLALDWEIVREPEPVPAAGTLIFPDFALWPRADPGRRWLLEIVGWWTPDYIRNELALLRSARIPRRLLCVDARRNCGQDDLPEHASILRFSNRLDAADVLRRIS